MRTTHRLGDAPALSAPTPSILSAPPISPPPSDAPALSWTEAAILVLMQTGEALRASQIVTRIHELGLPTASRSKTPAQSVNRDLHTALRHGDPRLTAGPLPGQFQATRQAGTASPRARVAGARRTVNTRGPRLPIEPLQGPVHAFGGMRSAAAGQMDDRTQQRLTRTFNRSVERGWIDLYDADTICVQLLGLHPCMLYGTGWWDTLAEADRVAGLAA